MSVANADNVTVKLRWAKEDQSKVDETCVAENASETLIERDDGEGPVLICFLFVHLLSFHLFDSPDMSILL